LRTEYNILSASNKTNTKHYRSSVVNLTTKYDRLYVLRENNNAKLYAKSKHSYKDARIPTIKTIVVLPSNINVECHGNSRKKLEKT